MQKRIFVVFVEDDAPTVELLLTGQVRKPVMTVPDRLWMPGVTAGSEINSAFTVNAYESGEFDAPSISPDKKWLSAELSENNIAVPPIKKSWKVLVRANTNSLAPGKHEASLRLRMKKLVNGETLLLTVPCSIYVREPLEVKPTSLFFGKIHVNGSKPIIKRVIFRFENAEQNNEPQIVSDLGRQFVLTWHRTSSHVAVLDVAVSFNLDLDAEGVSAAASKIVKGTITICFDNS